MSMGGVCMLWQCTMVRKGDKFQFLSMYLQNKRIVTSITSNVLLLCQFTWQRFEG